MTIPVSRLSELARCFSTGLYAAISNRSLFLVRNKKKKAHSRRYFLTEIEYMKDTDNWKIHLTEV